MTIKQLAAKLRHAADVLDELVGVDRATQAETPRTAEKIRTYLKRKRKFLRWQDDPKKVALAVKRRARTRLRNMKALKAVA